MTLVTIDSQKDCYPLDPAKMEALQTGTNSTELDRGIYQIRIHSGDFSDGSSLDRPFPPEPWVLLWISGGTVVNQKTGQAVGCTWSALNGYEDTLTLTVLDPTKISALFFATHKRDNRGIIQLSILKTDSMG